MSSSSPAPVSVGGISAADAITLASDQVVLEGVNQKLIEYVVHMGYVHRVLFGSPLVITSGTDGQHSPGSLHAKGLALDVRVKDLDEADQNIFLSIMTWSAPARGVSLFDERALKGAEHIHVEYHGE